MDAEASDLPSWSAEVVAHEGGALALNASYAASCGGSLRVSIRGLRAVIPPERGESPGSRLALKAGGEGASLAFEVVGLKAVAEAMTAGRALMSCLERSVLILTPEVRGGRRGQHLRRALSGSASRPPRGRPGRFR